MMNVLQGLGRANHPGAPMAFGTTIGGGPRGASLTGVDRQCRDRRAARLVLECADMKPGDVVRDSETITTPIRNILSRTFQPVAE